MSSLLLRTSTKLIFPLVLIFSAYIAIKGHNEPGGGFIGGLMAAVAFLLYRMTHGRGALVRLLPFHPRMLVFFGLLIALATAVVPMFFGSPFLTTTVIDQMPIGFGQSIHFASAVFFDAGVLMVVVGVSVGMIQRLHEEIDAQHVRKARGKAEVKSS